MSFEEHGELTYSLAQPSTKEKHKNKKRNKSQANPQSMMIKVNELNSKIQKLDLKMQLNNNTLEGKEITVTDDEQQQSKLGPLNDYSNIIIEETERSSEKGRMKSNTHLHVYTDHHHKMTIDTKPNLLETTDTPDLPSSFNQITEVVHIARENQTPQPIMSHLKTNNNIFDMS